MLDEESRQEVMQEVSLQSLIQLDMNALGALLPEDDYGDWLYALILFARVQRRKPSDEMLLNDFVFRLKTSPACIDPLRVMVTDKVLVKVFVRAMLGSAYNVPTLAILDTPQAVDAYDFPPACCIKPTHMSGEVILRTAAEAIETDKVKSWFSRNYYKDSRERQYRQLRPRVIVEPLIFGTAVANDYKIHCYRGRPRLIQIDLDRHTGHKRALCTPEWRRLTIPMTYPYYDGEVARPANLATMLAAASKLSAGFDYVRVDLYSDGEKCLVGEITNTPGNACERFRNVAEERAVSRLIFS